MYHIILINQAVALPLTNPEKIREIQGRMQGCGRAWFSC